MDINGNKSDTAKRCLAFDFGASSGRAMLAEYKDGRLELLELHRFANEPKMLDGVFCWDFDTLFSEVKTGIKKAVENGGFDSIGIDTWGVDFGLIGEDGKLLAPPVHYRDERTAGIPEKLFSVIPKEELYKRCGIQTMDFNTIYQLYYLSNNKSELLEKAECFLMIPDLFAYFLTGEKRTERTIASTTNLLNPYTKEWDYELIERLKLKKNIFPRLVTSGESYGMLSSEICDETGAKPVPVFAVACHDTASAVAAVPTEKSDFVYISCGTWSLFGTELPSPLINEKSMVADYTNEGGYGGTTRLLRNIMGLWLLQESRRQYIRDGFDISFNDMEQEAVNSTPFNCFINPDDSLFSPPGDLPARVVDYCKKTNQPTPKTRGENIGCLYQSLAFKYRLTLEKLQEMTGKKYEYIHIVGGGMKDSYLCQLTASACGIPVKAGPSEATAMGNAAAQLIALDVLPSIGEARKVIAKSIKLIEYTPVNHEKWEEHYNRFLKVTGS